MTDMKAKAETVRRSGKRTAISRRMRTGVCELFRHPWNIAILILAVALFYVLWRIRNVIPIPADATEVPLLAGVYRGTIAVLIILLFVVLVMGLLIAFGTPRSAAKIERSLVLVGLTDRYDCGPILVGNERIKGTSIRLLTFFSFGISREIWERRQQAIEDVLNVRWIGSPEYGGRRGDNRNYIVLKVAPGTEAPPKEVLYDDEL